MSTDILPVKPKPQTNYAAQALWFPVLILVAFGFLFVYSASSVYAAQKYGSEYLFLKKQFFYLIPAIFAAIIGIKVPLKYFDKYAGKLFLLTLLCTFLTSAPGIGKKVGGASRWIAVGNYSFQPSEFLKIATVLFISLLLAKSPRNFLQFWPIPIALGALLLQPDFGSSVILIAGITGIIFMHGIPKRIFGMLSVLFIPLMGIVMIAAPYRVKRLITFLDPFADPLGAGFQVIQSFVALTNGGWLGKGLGGSQQKLFFLPEAHTDFILAVIGEEMGFVGLLIIGVIYFMFFYTIIRIIKSANIHRERLLATGIFSMLATSTLVNLGVVIGFLPTKGLPLPFISHGGTSLIANFFMVGLLSQIFNNISQGKNSFSEEIKNNV